MAIPIVRRAFVSHSGRDHRLVEGLRRHMSQQCDVELVVNPFSKGRQIVREVDEQLKQCTHFILLTTWKALCSRWVYVESRFAKECQKHDSLIVVPVLIDGRPTFPFLCDTLSIVWRRRDGTKSLAQQICDAIGEGTPSNRLESDAARSEALKEEGRVCERQAAMLRDELLLHDAVLNYDAAITLNLANHNAWANRAWTNWKLNSRELASKDIRMAWRINPDSGNVRDVYNRLRLGLLTLHEDGPRRTPGLKCPLPGRSRRLLSWYYR